MDDIQWAAWEGEDLKITLLAYQEGDTFLHVQFGESHKSTQTNFPRFLPASGHLLHQGHSFHCVIYVFDQCNICLCYNTFVWFDNLWFSKTVQKNVPKTFC